MSSREEKILFQPTKATKGQSDEEWSRFSRCQHVGAIERFKKNIIPDQLWVCCIIWTFRRNGDKNLWKISSAPRRRGSIWCGSQTCRSTPMPRGSNNGGGGKPGKQHQNKRQIGVLPCQLVFCGGGECVGILIFLFVNWDGMAFNQWFITSWRWYHWNHWTCQHGCWLVDRSHAYNFEAFGWLKRRIPRQDEYCTSWMPERYKEFNYTSPLYYVVVILFSLLFSYTNFIGRTAW